MGVSNRYAIVGVIYILLLLGSAMVQLLWMRPTATQPKIFTRSDEKSVSVVSIYIDSGDLFINNSLDRGWYFWAKYYGDKPLINMSSNSLEIYVEDSWVVFSGAGIAKLNIIAISSNVNVFIYDCDMSISLSLNMGSATVMLVNGSFDLDFTIKGNLYLVGNNISAVGTISVREGRSLISIVTSVGGVFSYELKFCTYRVEAKGYQKTEQKNGDTIRGVLYREGKGNNLGISAQYSYLSFMLYFGTSQ